ncbi:hypothetical protein STCU_08931 [Strigomonas culicis]|uniref:RecQ-mediated genome instability protein 1 n=1 Tax=Strigomonas culicis TaxID=28005 RepID=S9TVL3_9TRYP|nr:hypothetical protein STCU_08931 [Strigomonas culicis]|eukprot:EPY20588.1 hypothetical protein STCU_08931 [Strigomonas culicis]
MADLAEEVKSKYFLSVAKDYAERAKLNKPTLTADELYRKVLCDHIKDFAPAGSVLPYGIASQTAATLPNNVVLQINSARDATQPLRPCAESDDAEAALNAAMQRNTSSRLLKLVLSDGSVEISAVELSTLAIFKGIPIPGEKLLVKGGAEVRSGAIIMTNDNIVLLGGEVAQLKNEFLAHRRRKEMGYKVSGGLEGAPRFQPLTVGQHYQKSAPPPLRGGGGRGGAYPGGGSYDHGLDHGQGGPRGRERGGRGYGGGGGGRGYDRGGRGQASGGRGGGRGDDGRGRAQGYAGTRGNAYRGGGGGGRGRGEYRGRGGAAYDNHFAYDVHAQYADPTVQAPPPRVPDRIPVFNEQNFPSLA